MRVVVLLAICFLAGSASAQNRVMSPGLVESLRRETTFAPLPDYPMSAKRNHHQGSGLLLLHLRKDGGVESVELLKSTGHRELDRAAIDA